MPELVTCHIVEATYVEGVAEKRTPYRQEHLDRMQKLYDEGVVLVAGALADLSASVLVLAVESERAARRIAETDVYWRNGIWTSLQIRQLNRVAFEKG
ncbi:MAG: YciI family protein [Actinomycetota bacterium]|nr:YciI family protein [Actinomycetota bacterium]